MDEHGEPFYPVMMSYYLDLYYFGTTVLPVDPDETFMDEHVGFGRYVFYCADEEYDFPVDQGALSVLQDLKEMKADGFNTVRLINFVIKSVGSVGQSQSGLCQVF
ncbi:MAG: hypothetical protein IPI95_03625 [Flavobacteriales bacterium]|nr:hypothetical protein [Flavobacteriales bacterium]